MNAVKIDCVFRSCRAVPCARAAAATWVRRPLRLRHRAPMTRQVFRSIVVVLWYSCHTDVLSLGLTCKMFQFSELRGRSFCLLFCCCSDYVIFEVAFSRFHHWWIFECFSSNLMSLFFISWPNQEAPDTSTMVVAMQPIQQDEPKLVKISSPASD